MNFKKREQEGSVLLLHMFICLSVLWTCLASNEHQVNRNLFPPGSFPQLQPFKVTKLLMLQKSSLPLCRKLLEQPPVPFSPLLFTQLQLVCYPRPSAGNNFIGATAESQKKQPGGWYKRWELLFTVAWEETFSWKGRKLMLWKTVGILAGKVS